MKKFLLFTLVLFTVNVFAANTDKTKQAISQETVIKKFISWDKKLNTLDTFYEQETSFEGTLISKSFGHLIKTGQNLRLETLENDKVTLIIDNVFTAGVETIKARSSCKKFYSYLN